MARMKELEDEEHLKVETVAEGLTKSDNAISAVEDDATGLCQALCHNRMGLPGVSHQPNLVSLSCKLDAENAIMADWLIRLINN